MKQTTHAILILLGMMAFLSGCKFNPNEGINWNVDLLAPIAYSDVTISDVIQDSSLVSTGSDNVLTLIFRDSVAGTALSDFVELPDTTLDLVVTLDSLSLDPGPIEQRITLGQLARQLQAQGDIIGDFIIGAHDSTVLLLPGIPGLTSGTIPIDAAAFFEEAEIESGFLALTIENQLPVDLENVKFEIENASGPPLILEDSFAIIQSRDSVKKQYDIAGKRIESQLSGALVNMDIAGGLNVRIDTNDYIRIRLEPIQLRVREATAIFPEQTILDSTASTVYKFPPKFADIELTKLKIKSGRISAKSISTIEDTIRFAYSIPSATRDGEIPEVILKLNPSIGGIPAEQTQEADLGGFDLDLTLGGTTFNTILQAYKVDLVYSGKLVNIDLEDSVIVSFGLLDIEPTYVEGYLGKDKISFTGQEAIDIFDMIDVGRLEFNRPKASIVFTNSVGVDSRVVINNIAAANTKTGEEVSLYGTAMRAGPITIPGPVFGDTFGIVPTRVEFDASEGNLDDFVNVMPNLLKYDIDINANYNGSPGKHDNFATTSSEIGAFVEFELPLDGIVENLILRDTSELAFNQSTSGDLDAISGGKLKIIIENQFPLEATVSATIYDASWQVVDKIAIGHVVEAGLPDPATGYVNDPAVSTLVKSFDIPQLDRILETGAFIDFRYSLDTRPDDTHVNVFADYKIAAKLVGEFNYEINP